MINQVNYIVVKYRALKFSAKTQINQMLDFCFALFDVTTKTFYSQAFVSMKGTRKWTAFRLYFCPFDSNTNELYHWMKNVATIHYFQCIHRHLRRMIYTYLFVFRKDFPKKFWSLYLSFYLYLSILICSILIQIIENNITKKVIIK